MRAKMSRIDYWRGIPDCGPATAALAEARAILAETEPWSNRVQDWPNHHQPVCLDGIGHNERAALAEACARLISGIDAILTCKECGHAKSLHKAYSAFDPPEQCRGSLGTCWCGSFRE